MTPQNKQTVRDLAEEAKKRIVLLFICVIGLSYLMSLTSSSVWINLPAAASLIFLLRYLSYDLGMRQRAATYNKPPLGNHTSQNKSSEGPHLSVEKSNWKKGVDSPPVEAAIDQFTRHLVSEWVTDLWYSRVTPNRDAPEELMQIMNGAIGEISVRVREINLIDLLTRDIIDLICNHLELFRIVQAKIGKHELRMLSTDQQDKQLKLALSTENKLHPALFSAAAEHKFLQHLMGGLISHTFKPDDLNCSFFRFTVRELLACAVMRPVVNLANPRFINERIESFAISLANKTTKVVSTSSQDKSRNKPSGSSRASSDHFSGFHDRSVSGVELVQIKPDHSRIDSHEKKNGTRMFLPKDQDHSGHDLSAGGSPLKNSDFVKKSNYIAGDTQSSHYKTSSPLDSQVENGKDPETQRPGQQWGQMLDIMSTRKTRALAAEHFDNMWTKGRNYSKKDGTNLQAKQDTGNSLVKGSAKHQITDGIVKVCTVEKNPILSVQENSRTVETDPHTLVNSSQGKMEQKLIVCIDETNSDSESSYPTEDEESNSVTGLGSPGTKVWDSRNNKIPAVSHIRHPLESPEGNLLTKSGKGQVKYHRPSRTLSGRKRSRLSNRKVPVWQEVERTTFLLGDGRDILNASKGEVKSDSSSDEVEIESWGRVHSGAAASSSSPASVSASESSLSLKSSENTTLTNPFLKLRCEVLGANVVKSDSRTFAVYSISVTDADNINWSIKRRFRHFEELHRRLKEFPEYNLSLPPKHFLSSGLDMPVIHERCRLLHKYLKKLLMLPNISKSIEVWDFLSIDSQTYMFPHSLSIIKTLSVDLDDKPREKGKKGQFSIDAINDQPPSRRIDTGTTSKNCSLQVQQNHISDGMRLETRNMEQLSAKKHGKDNVNSFNDLSGSDTDSRLQRDASYKKSEKSTIHVESGTEVLQDPPQSFADSASDPTVPTEWVPPNLSVPILDLVDVIFQLHDGGWIRRQFFWVAKQVLQLGMGDAFDDWLIEKIQLLRKGSVIASGINKIEQILWPDGIFITRHPKRQRPPAFQNQSQSSQSESQTAAASPKKELGNRNNEKDTKNSLSEQQQLDIARRAKFVHELMIDNAPAALISLVGRKNYESCAQDVYFFLQSPVCLKQLAYELLELLLLAAFPELDNVVKLCHEEKEQFGELDVN